MDGLDDICQCSSLNGLSSSWNPMVGLSAFPLMKYGWNIIQNTSYWTNHNEILHVTRQICCLGICTILLWSDCDPLQIAVTILSDLELNLNIICGSNAWSVQRIQLSDEFYWTEDQKYYTWLFCDDVIKWKHFPRYWPFVRGIHWSPVNSPHKGQWRGALMFSLICAWINHWVSIHETGDLRRHRAHYDIIVMWAYWGRQKRLSD